MTSDDGVLLYCANENYLACPQCGEDYLHLRAVEVVAHEPDDYKATSGTRIEPWALLNRPSTRESLTRSEEYRGPMAVVELSCEMCGQVTALRLHQHKGQVITELVAVPGDLWPAGRGGRWERPA